MGLVRKADTDDVAAGKGGTVDMSTILRKAVAAEIERQRQGSVQGDSERDRDTASDQD